MLHEISADQVIGVADALMDDRVGGEQQARIFDPSGG
jgi:hypothetical protein